MIYNIMTALFFMSASILSYAAEDPDFIAIENVVTSTSLRITENTDTIVVARNYLSTNPSGSKVIGRLICVAPITPPNKPKMVRSTKRAELSVTGRSWDDLHANGLDGSEIIARNYLEGYPLLKFSCKEKTVQPGFLWHPEILAVFDWFKANESKEQFVLPIFEEPKDLQTRAIVTINYKRKITRHKMSKVERSPEDLWLIKPNSPMPYTTTDTEVIEVPRDEIIESLRNQFSAELLDLDSADILDRDSVDLWGREWTVGISVGESPFTPIDTQFPDSVSIFKTQREFILGHKTGVRKISPPALDSLEIPDFGSRGNQTMGWDSSLYQIAFMFGRIDNAPKRIPESRERGISTNFLTVNPHNGSQWLAVSSADYKFLTQ